MVRKWVNSTPLQASNNTDSNAVVNKTKEACFGLKLGETNS